MLRQTSKTGLDTATHTTSHSRAGWAPDPAGARVRRRRVGYGNNTSRVILTWSDLRINANFLPHFATGKRLPRSSLGIPLAQTLQHGPASSTH
ncbi:hypothetical protein NDU88_007731 [Pleurodeles waltl]|uniref:Uncharacterized protein n=1 Tax=Pleurodeles waltl TaxID=8319 RepID=A0AAV7VTE8_PLEWA|nr:hypothetical protein NDU88_007731 [Pleurodeles waltl]